MPYKDPEKGKQHKREYYAKNKNRIMLYRKAISDRRAENTKSCECGCNELIPSINTNGEPARFKLGHNTEGVLSPTWNGGIHFDTQGYVNVKRREHRFADAHGYVAYHRIVFESYYRCCMLSWGDVHHIDNNRRNNFPNNLHAMMGSDHDALTDRERWKKGQLRFDMLNIESKGSGFVRKS
jgi:hypothetical protein